VAGWYFVGAGALRFAIEFLRPKSDRLPSGITIAQLIALTVLALGAALLARTRVRGAQDHDPRLAASAA
jgi:prolipoprotein diacylglyceryltransferase